MTSSPYSLPPGPGRRQLLRDDYLDIRPSDYTVIELASLESELVVQPWSTGRETIADDRMPGAFLFAPGPTRRALLHDQYRNVGDNDFAEDERSELETRAAAMRSCFVEMGATDDPVDQSADVTTRHP